MVLEFTLTPHTKNIIVGRKVGRDEDDVLTCASKNCLSEKEGYGREIVVQGFMKCPRCNNKVTYPDDLGKFDSEKQEASSLICPTCSRNIPLKDESGNFAVQWTQRVVSKHRHSKHDYYHGECWDSMFIESEEEEHERED